MANFIFIKIIFVFLTFSWIISNFFILQHPCRRAGLVFPIKSKIREVSQKFSQHFVKFFLTQRQKKEEK